MIIIDSNGDHKYVQGTKTLQTSDHPVFQARIELALGEGTWLYAPSSGHKLARFRNVNQTQAKVEEFEKELRFHLQKYDPAVAERLVGRNSVSMNLQIAEGALNV